MPGIMVGTVKLEIDVAKMRDIAVRLSKVRMGNAEDEQAAIIVADFNQLMDDAMGELTRIADGFDLLAKTEVEMREAAAAMAVREFRNPCPCAACRAARAREENEKRGLN